jgi:hypothetical protein
MTFTSKPTTQLHNSILFKGYVHLATSSQARDLSHDVASHTLSSIVTFISRQGECTDFH